MICRCQECGRFISPLDRYCNNCPDPIETMVSAVIITGQISLLMKNPKVITAIGEETSSFLREVIGDKS